MRDGGGWRGDMNIVMITVAGGGGGDGGRWWWMWGVVSGLVQGECGFDDGADWKDAVDGPGGHGYFAGGGGNEGGSGSCWML